MPSKRKFPQTTAIVRPRRVPSVPTRTKPKPGCVTATALVKPITPTAILRPVKAVKP